MKGEPKLRMPENWTPPVPSYSSRVVPEEGHLVILYLGAQARSQDVSRAAFLEISSFFDDVDDSPYWLDRAAYCSASGYWEHIVIAYFVSVEAFEAWVTASGFGTWWADSARLSQDAGLWQERLVLSGDRIEALHSSPNKDAHSHGGEIVGPIRHHAYWGGMRDRLQVSRHDHLESAVTGYPERGEVESYGRRVVVPVPQNLAIIRSGQDRRFASVEERALYDEIVRGNLLKGMAYLEERGSEVGCFACRYVTEIDASGQETDRNFGHCLFRSLEDLENWAKSHPTHLAIFGSFFELQKRCDNDMTLRFYHEVGVTPASGLHFEYVNCHPETGLLGYFCPGGRHAFFQKPGA